MTGDELKRPVRLVGPMQRAYAGKKLDAAPDGWIVTFREPTRSLDQNAKLWAMLHDVARFMPMDRRHTPEEWKCIFMQAAGWEQAFLPGLAGGFFPAGFASSKMSVREMANLINFIQAWGDEQGIRWSEHERGAA